MKQVPKDFVYATAAESSTPGYLRRKFQHIMEQQKAAALRVTSTPEESSHRAHRGVADTPASVAAPVQLLKRIA